ncbi:putative disease resistance protein (TIR-NBS-LRR class), partial [Trifolium medium]|nr:putative disease resistance protein (TIR-NBS-LRR class) [Trifolium medium]
MDDRQGGTFTTTTQTNPEEQNIVNRSNEECGESGECVEENEEARMCDGCGVVKIVEAIETPHKEELPREWPCTEKANTVDNEEVMMVVEGIEGLLDKEISCEQKREMENKAEI